MGEIKSTMDIIMEKTKGLTMTEEEKKALKKRELSGRVKGIFQKFLDGAMTLDRVEMEMAALLKDEPALTGEIAREECADRIRLGGDNEPLLEILEAATAMDPAPLRERIAQAERLLEQEKTASEASLRKKLAEKGVSGSAVVPNAWADPGWRDAASRTEADLRRALRERLA